MGYYHKQRTYLPMDVMVAYPAVFDLDLKTTFELIPISRKPRIRVRNPDKTTKA